MFLGQIRDRFPATARVILSGYSETTLATRTVAVAHRYIAKPCNKDDLESTIERICALQDILRTREMQQMVGAIGELPSLSSSYTALSQAAQDPRTSIEQIAKIIEHDVAMSAKVLQLVNSAFFGLARVVTTAKSAVVYLGMEVVKNLALASEAFRVFVPDSRISPAVCESIQSHSHRTAAIAAVLPSDTKTKNVTVLAALLHDVGRLVLASKTPDKFCTALSRSRELDCEPFEAEEELMGTTHAEIGAYLLGLWGIPDLVVEAIAFHHRPTRIPHSGFDSCMAVYVADLLAHQNSPGSELRESDRACLDAMGVLPRFDEFRQLASQVGN